MAKAKEARGVFGWGRRRVHKRHVDKDNNGGKG